MLVTDIKVANGQFDPSLRLCMLDESYVCKLEITPSYLAVIVHEATHARLHAVGIGCPESLRARIERLCMHQELDLAARLPGGASAAQRAQRSLMLPDSTWDQVTFAERRLALIRSWGWPQWVVRLIERGVRRSAA